MGAISIILLVAFVIICILLVCLVLVQNEEGGGMGGLFGGSGNSAAFGSRSGNVLTKTTYILVTLFFLSSFGLAFLNKEPSVKSLDSAVQQEQSASSSEGFWLDESSSSGAAPVEVSPAE